MAKTNEIIERESKTDIAYRLMSKKKKSLPINFYELWEKVKEELAKVLEQEEMINIEEDISFFYTNLTLDGRFVNVGENKWNLRENVTFDKVHLDPNEVYTEEDDVIESEEEDEEELSKGEYTGADEYDEFGDSAASDSDLDAIREQKETEEEENF